MNKPSGQTSGNGRPQQRQASGGPQPQQQQQRQPQRPVHEVRIGSVKAAVWVSESQYGVRHTIKVCKLYKVEDGGVERWQSTDVFGRDDLLALAKVVDLAHTWVVEHAQGPEIPF